MVEWGEFFLSIIFMGILARWAGKMVRDNAPFYAKKNILVVGSVFGSAFGIIVHVLGKVVTPLEGRSLLIAFILIGLMLIKSICYKPDPIDWAHKTRQTAVSIGIFYLITSGILLLLNG